MNKIIFVLSLFIVIVSFYNNKDTVYIYHDTGVSPECLEQTVYTFRNLLKKYSIKTINAEQVKEGYWINNAILFIMPGGMDLPYARKLNGKGNEAIKKYVINGGSFVGICAGAYYSSSYLEFDKNGPLEVLGDRELNFFQGTSIGPILAPYDYKTQSGSRSATIHTTIPNVNKTNVFYNGGGFFKNAYEYPHTSVIATYNNNLPAIILINYGRGKVLLSGVHFEYDPSLLDPNDEYIKKILDQLHKNNSSRKALLVGLMKIIGVR